jgi:hypothetical protein
MKVQKNENNLMHREKRFAFENAPRCNAKTKNNNGKPCLCPAVRGKNRCRLHGGSIGSGAPLGNSNALTHGASTAEIKIVKKKVRQVMQLSKTSW